MGLWSAFTLARRGHRVLLADAWSPGHALSASGGESRVIRCGYGRSDRYFSWALRSMRLWSRWQREWNADLFVRTGVLWMVVGDEPYAKASLARLRRSGVPHERLTRRELEKAYPQIRTDGVRWAILETRAGLIRARRACRTIAEAFVGLGGGLRQAELRPGAAASGKLLDVVASTGERLGADRFVFACGAWLPRLFPSILGRRLRVSRKEVFFFGTPPGDPAYSAGRLPVWMELGTSCYGIPAIGGRGFKVHPDFPGRSVDPTTQDRRPSRKLLAAARDCLKRRFPGLAHAPLVESRVCQYTETADAQMLFDVHPAYSNVWVLGGGSGHCFKHGPVIGELVADVVTARSGARIPAELRLTHAPRGRHF